MQKNCRGDESRQLESSFSTSPSTDTSEELHSSDLDLLSARPSKNRSRQLNRSGHIESSHSSEAITKLEDHSNSSGSKVCRVRKCASSLDLLAGRSLSRKQQQRRRRRKPNKHSGCLNNSLLHEPSHRLTLEETELSCGDVVLVHRKAQYIDDDSGQAKSSVVTEEEYKHITPKSKLSSLILSYSNNLPENKDNVSASVPCCGQDLGGGEGSLILVSRKQSLCETEPHPSCSVHSGSSDLEGPVNQSSSCKRGTSLELGTNLNKKTDCAHKFKEPLCGMQSHHLHFSTNLPHHASNDTENHHTRMNSTYTHQDQRYHNRHDNCGDQNVSKSNVQKRSMSPTSGDASMCPSSSQRCDHKMSHPIPHSGNEEIINLNHKETSSHPQMDSKIYDSKGICSGKGGSAMSSVMAVPGSFPFQPTPSGNLKIVPNQVRGPQVVYESKKLSVLVANPKKGRINVIKESSSKTSIESDMKNLSQQGFHTKELSYPTSAENGGSYESPDSMQLYPIAKRADIGDFTGCEYTHKSESEYLTRGSDDDRSDAELSRLLCIGDNEIEWSKVALPAKSSMLKLLEDRIKNFVNPDIIVCVENNQFSCHHLVLQCYSSFFDKDCEKIVELPPDKVTTQAFSLIYNWMIYSGQDSYTLLRRDNILEIFRASQYLGITELEEQCWAFIDSPTIFFEATAFMLYVDARKKGNKEVAQLMVPRIITFFLPLVASRNFLQLPVEDVCTLLSSNYIKIQCEMQVFMSAVRWLTCDWSSRACHVVEVMRCVRFGWILPWQLVDVRRNPANPEFLQVTSHPEVMQMLEDGVAFAIVWYWYGKTNEQECHTWVNALDLKVPQQRNWDSKKQEYSSYQEFVDELDAIRKAMEKKRRQLKRMRRMNMLRQPRSQSKTSNNLYPSSNNLPPFDTAKDHSNGGNIKSLVRESYFQQEADVPGNVSGVINGLEAEDGQNLSPRSEFCKDSNESSDESPQIHRFSTMHDFPPNLAPPSEWLKVSEDAGINASSVGRK